jgi:predicted ABC-type ATPase
VASAIAEFFRQRLLEARTSFTLETVMSHPGKVALLAQAQQLDYRTYLYFIATDDPAINISRVRSRVERGGHPVPEDKIVKRYHASLGLLMDAIRNSNRAYIFDNSGEGRDRTWIGKSRKGRIWKCGPSKCRHGLSEQYGTRSSRALSDRSRRLLHYACVVCYKTS